MQDSLFFSGFELNLHSARLLRAGEDIALSPKAYDVLQLFARSEGKLILKEDLITAVWKNSAVGDGALKNVITELRQALGDDPKLPRFIETLHRRGYRFVSPVQAQGAAAPAVVLHPATRRTLPRRARYLVGREGALARFEEAWECAVHGEGQLFLLCGEGGIGKTSLIECFASSHPIDHVSGQCIEQAGLPEPYLPILEMVNKLVHRHGDVFIGLMRRYAPTWLAQLPWIEVAAPAPSLEGAGSAREHMPRELGELLFHWSASSPLLLILEDLHWSDQATSDLLLYLGHRLQNCHCLIIGSYRLAELKAFRHPFDEARRSLLTQGRCTQIELGLLSESEVLTYLQLRMPSVNIPLPVARAIFQRCDGLPIFLTSLGDELLRLSEQGPLNVEGVRRMLQQLPEGVRFLAERVTAHLSSAEQALLTVATVCGHAFSPALLAFATGAELAEVEAWCVRMAADLAFFTPRPGDAEKETRAFQRYDFQHAFYREICYRNLLNTTRRSVHLQIANWYAQCCGEQRRDELAAELASHYEQGRDFFQAAKALRVLARRAASRFAHGDEVAILKRTLQLLTTLSEEAALSDQALDLQIDTLLDLVTTLGPIEGFGNPQLLAYVSLAERCIERRGAVPEAMLYYWLTGGYYMAHAQFKETEAQLDTLQALAEQAGVSTWDCSVLTGRGTLQLFKGDQVAASRFFAAAQISAPACSQHQRLLDPLPQLHFFAGQSLALQGDLPGARAAYDVLADYARAQPNSLQRPNTLWGCCLIAQLMDDPDLLARASADLDATAQRFGIPFFVMISQIFVAWTRRHSDQHRARLLISESVEGLSQCGMLVYVCYAKALLGELLLDAGLLSQAANELDQALIVSKNYTTHFYDAEIWRLKARLEALRNPGSGQQQHCLQQAIALAKAQGADCLLRRAEADLAKM